MDREQEWTGRCRRADIDQVRGASLWMYWSIIVGTLAVVFYRFVYPRYSSAPPDALTSRDMAVAPALKFLTVPATSKHTATVIFVHGLGDTGYGWKPVADMFKVDTALAHVKWLLPHSPIQAVRANMGIEMPSWFDIYSFGFDTAEDEAGMLKSAGLINEFINHEVVVNGIDPSRIVLGGFSQGGTMSLLAGLTGPHRMAGLVVLSGWLPLRDKFKSMVSQNAASTPIFWGTGSADALVKAQFAEESSKFLIDQIGIPIAKRGELGGLSYNVYEGMGHATVPKELDELKAFIKMAIPESK